MCKKKKISVIIWVVIDQLHFFIKIIIDQYY